MKYSFAVKYNGEFYPPNTEIPEVEETDVEETDVEETSAEKPKRTRSSKK